MTACNNSSRHLASTMLGLMALAWAPIPFLSPPGFKMVYIVNSYGLAWVWSLYLLACGALLLLGVAIPYRKARLMGLGLSFIGWSSFLTMYLRDMIYSPSMVTMMVCAGMSVTILISDVRRKPRVGVNQTLDC